MYLSFVKLVIWLDKKFICHIQDSNTLIIPSQHQNRSMERKKHHLTLK